MHGLQSAACQLVFVSIIIDLINSAAILNILFYVEHVQIDIFCTYGDAFPIKVLPCQKHQSRKSLDISISMSTTLELSLSSPRITLHLSTSSLDYGTR
jgi:hypothetical protein